jgi:hypothetical protein
MCDSLLIFIERAVLEQEKENLSQLLNKTRTEMEATQTIVTQVTLQLEAEKSIVVNLKVELQQLQLDFATEKTNSANLQNELNSVSFEFLVILRILGTFTFCAIDRVSEQDNYRTYCREGSNSKALYRAGYYKIQSRV